MLPVFLAAALAAVPPAADPVTGAPTLSARVSDPKVIRAAVDAALIQDVPANPANSADSTVLRGTGAAYAGFARTVAEARVPDCLHPDGLKNQFTPISGVYAIPFVFIAKLRGKCN